MISLKFVFIFVDSVGVIKVCLEILLFLFVFVLILFLFFLAQCLPIVLDHFVDISRAGVLVLFFVLMVSLFEEASVRSQSLSFSGELLILFVKVVSFSDSDVVKLFIVVLFVIRKTFPFFSESLGEFVPLACTLGSLLARSLEEEAHVGIHGGLRGLQVGDAKALFEVPLVLFKAVFVSLHEKIDYRSAG